MTTAKQFLLINPPMVVDELPKYPSFGIAYIAQVLRAHGYVVDLLDIDANRFSREEVLARIHSAIPDFIGIGGLVTVYPYLCWLVPELRKSHPSAPIILGGPVAASLREHSFDTLPIDYAVLGEGEITTIELLSTLSAKETPSGVQGIAYRTPEGQVIFNPARPLMPTLDDVPMIDYSMFPMQSLLKNANGVVQVHTQRGCPNSCTFCFNCFRVSSSKVRYRKPEHVIDEIEFLNKNHDVSLFALSGECITMNKKWLISFCKDLMAKNLKIKYRITSRVDCVDEERMHWLKQSGCEMISFGLESGSNEILKCMGKNAKVEQGLAAVKLSQKYIPRVEASIMLGYLGETRKTLHETEDFCKKINVLPHFFYATPFPGTVLYQEALQRGLILDEQSYLLSLDKTSIFRRMKINLTDMPNHEAEQRIGALVRRVNRHYLLKSLSTQLLFKVMRSIRENGLKGTLKKTANALANICMGRR